MRFAKKLHYFLKYLIIGLPIIMIILSFIIPKVFTINSYNVNIFESFFQGINSFYRDVDMFAPYYSFIDLLGIDIFQNSYSITLASYPLWVFLVYSFDIVLDVLIFLPKLIHSFFEKMGGGEY